MSEYNPRPSPVDGNKPRYITMPVVSGASVNYGVYDTTTENFVDIIYMDELLAQEKCNELNRLKAPH